MSTSTISAITTAVGPAAVGIVRLSGPQALNIAREIFVAAGRKSLPDYPPRTLVFGHVREGAVDVDEVLAVYMPAPHSYTAEDVVEIQCHGGAVSLQKILALTYQHGAEPAAPGEFTKRAFLNGRLDLVQAEAVFMNAWFSMLTAGKAAGLTSPWSSWQATPDMRRAVTGQLVPGHQHRF